MSEEIEPYPDYKKSALKWLGKIPSHWAEKRAKYFLREVDERSTMGLETCQSWKFHCRTGLVSTFAT